MRIGIAFAALACGSLGACASVAPTGLPPVGVQAVAETAPVGTNNEDAADDPAIWRNAADPAASLIVATDKKGGLYVYDLQGAQKSFMPAPGLNNVDLVTLPDGRVLVMASDRSDLAMAHILLAELDTTDASLTVLERIQVGPGEGYGICVGDVAEDGSLNVYSAPKEGVIYRTGLQFLAGSWNSGSEPLNSVPSQPEGCVYDPRTGMLYIGEEAGGIWAMSGMVQDGAKQLVAPVDNRYLVADVEGLALVPEGDSGGYLVASSQGDNAYAVFALPDMTPLGRFAVTAGALGATEETDGIELAAGAFGPGFPDGLFIAQDGQNGAQAQNFKLVSWAAIKVALGLD